MTESQNRFLTNWGTKADVSTVHKNHSFKFGTQLQQTRLEENFAMGVTSPDIQSGVPGSRRNARWRCRA